jgi:hypothetical protein
VSAGQTISDGTCVWTVVKCADKDKVVPAENCDLYVNGQTLTRDTPNFEVRVSCANGGFIELNGENKATKPGTFRLTAQINENTYSDLVGWPNKELTWDGDDLASAAVIAESLGAGTGYIKRRDGSICQWGHTSQGSLPVVFPISFTSQPCVVAVPRSTSESTPVYITTKDVSTTGFDIYKSSNAFNYVAWYAIGK